MKRSIVAQSNASISLSGERLVVAGGTQGVGEGVAYRFAKAGAEVWIVGRNETKGEDPRRGLEKLQILIASCHVHGTAKAVLAKLNEISQEQKIEPPPEHYFIRADLTLISEAKRVAETIRVRAGSQGIEYLVMTQGACSKYPRVRNILRLSNRRPTQRNFCSHIRIARSALWCSGSVAFRPGP
jgi:NAD(P)-dependent dehydrogenase (short-subunit alcohol dehydrogenase family)